MNVAERNALRAVQQFEPEADAVYTIETVANLLRLPRRTILLYCRHHLISPVSDPESEGYHFDNEAVRTLRRIEYLHSVHGINLAGTRMILELMRALEELENESRTTV